MIFGDKESTFLGGADSIIQVGSDSLILCFIIYKFVTTNTFNCHCTIACMYYAAQICLIKIVS